MSWANRLIETYDNYFRDGAPADDSSPLVPVGFVPKKIGIRVNLNRDGTFASAQILDDEVWENVPSTPGAEGRVGPPVPYPLSDEIRYTAGDLSLFTVDNYDSYFSAYEKQLREWTESGDSPEELRIFLQYIVQKTLTADLLQSGLIRLDKDGYFPNKFVKTIVGFTVFDGVSAYIPISGLFPVIDSWQVYLQKSMEGNELSYASGMLAPPLYNHARIEGTAKLISQKDAGQTFQFKGRFETPEQAYAVSYSDSSKISNTIRWLKGKSAFRNYGMTFLTWSTKAKRVIPLLEEDEPEEFLTYTAESYARAIREKMNGYQNEVQYRDDAAIVLLGLETATPGRMSVTYYEELGGKRYLQMLEKWYTSCSWLLCRNRKETKQLYLNYATPTPHEIAEAVYGFDAVRLASQDKKAEKSATKQMKKLYNDLVICIANGRQMPSVYAMEAYKKACSPNSFTDSSGKWQRISWQKSMAVALAMLKSSFEKEDYNVALNTECTDRSYLFGRLVAVADEVELRAMDFDEHQTNAVRSFTAMQQKPATTWVLLDMKLKPYFTKLNNYYIREYKRLIDEIYNQANYGELSNNTPLTPKFLEGYHNQRYELTKKKEN